MKYLTILLSVLLFSCSSTYTIIPQEINTCNCLSDSARIEYIKLATGKDSNVQSISINANKVKHNDFENGRGIRDLDQYCPSNKVYFIWIEREFDTDVYDRAADYNRLFFCDSLDAVNYCDLKNK